MFGSTVLLQKKHRSAKPRFFLQHCAVYVWFHHHYQIYNEIGVREGVAFSEACGLESGSHHG